MCSCTAQGKEDATRAGDDRRGGIDVATREEVGWEDSGVKSDFETSRGSQRAETEDAIGAKNSADDSRATTPAPVVDASTATATGKTTEESVV
jgi:hypothetical protein